VCVCVCVCVCIYIYHTDKHQVRFDLSTKSIVDLFASDMSVDFTVTVTSLCPQECFTTC